jgi:hypothetical protein
VPIEYELLSVEDRLEIIRSRLRQLEAEHFQQQLNRRSLEQAMDGDGEARNAQLVETDAALESLERAIELHRVERAALAPP